MSRRCKAPATIDREGGDCADPTCRAHDVNEDGPICSRCKQPAGHHSDTGACPLRNPDHDTACRCSGCLADPYIDPAGPTPPLEGDFGPHLREHCPNRTICDRHAHPLP